MILDITEIEANVNLGSKAIIFVAALGETFERCLLRASSGLGHACRKPCISSLRTTNTPSLMLSASFSTFAVSGAKESTISPL